MSDIECLVRLVPIKLRLAYLEVVANLQLLERILRDDVLRASVRLHELEQPQYVTDRFLTDKERKRVSVQRTIRFPPQVTFREISRAVHPDKGRRYVFRHGLLRVLKAVEHRASPPRSDTATKLGSVVDTVRSRHDLITRIAGISKGKSGRLNQSTLYRCELLQGGFQVIQFAYFLQGLQGVLVDGILNGSVCGIEVGHKVAVLGVEGGIFPFHRTLLQRINKTVGYRAVDGRDKLRLCRGEGGVGIGKVGLCRARQQRVFIYLGVAFCRVLGKGLYAVDVGSDGG